MSQSGHRIGGRRWTEKRTTIYVRNGVVVLSNVHKPSQCAGRHCVIHNPARNTSSRNLWWRGDRGFFEEVCPCGIGHPSPEDVEYWDSIGAEHMAVHGCCGKHCYTDGYEGEEA